MFNIVFRDVNRKIEIVPRMGKKTLTVGFRIEEELQKRLIGVADLTQIDHSSICRAAVDAVVRYIETNKSVTFPMHVVTQEEYNKITQSL